MPICVHCATPAKALYVTFGPSHILCTRCKECRQFTDPYVEHEAIVVAIDLILVKPQAYRHILFNRLGLHAAHQKHEDKPGKQGHLGQSQSVWAKLFEGWKPWSFLVRHFLALLLVDSYLRWYYLCADGKQAGSGITDQVVLVGSYFRILRSNMAIILSLHCIVILLSLIYHRLLVHLTHRKILTIEKHDLDRFNLTPTFLLCLLLLWQQQPSDQSDADSIDNGWQWDETSIDWIIRVLVNGLSAGVALGVVLPLQRTRLGATMATVILVMSWYIQFAVSQVLQLPFHSGVGVLQTEAGRIGSARYCAR